MVRRRLLRITVEFLILLVVYFAALYAMAHFRVMEAILAPGGRSAGLYVALTASFLLLRFFVIFFAPGWFLARVCFAVLSRPLESQPASADTK